MALRKNAMMEGKFDEFDTQKIKDFLRSLRYISKPTLILANKIDLPSAADNFIRLRDKYQGCSSHSVKR